MVVIFSYPFEFPITTYCFNFKTVSFGIKSFCSKMARRGNPIPQDFQAMNDYERDMEIAKLRRTVELLQRQLEQQQNNGQPRRN